VDLCDSAKEHRSGIEVRRGRFFLAEAAQLVIETLGKLLAAGGAKRIKQLNLDARDESMDACNLSPRSPCEFSEITA
jgi:hypothetical protein